MILSPPGPEAVRKYRASTEMNTKELERAISQTSVREMVRIALRAKTDIRDEAVRSRILELAGEALVYGGDDGSGDDTDVRRLRNYLKAIKFAEEMNPLP